MADSILSRGFVLVTLSALFINLNYFFLFIVIVDFSESLGASAFLGGIAAGIYVVGGLISRLFFGKYIELVGRKRMLICCLSIAIFIGCLYPFITSVAILIPIRFLHGMALALASSCNNDIVAKLIPEKRKGEGMGYYFLSSTIAMAVGPFVGMFFAGSESFNFVFILGVAMIILALLCGLFITVEEEELTDEQKREARGFRIGNMFQLDAIPLAITSMVFYFSYSGILSFISSFTEGGPLKDAAAFFFLFVAAGTLVSRFLSGRIFDRRGANIVIIPAMLLFILGLYVYSTTSEPWLFLLSGLPIGYGISNVYAICQTIVLRRSPQHHYGVTTSTFNALNDIGNGLGPTVMGLLITTIGFGDMYAVSIGIAFLSLAIYWMVHGRYCSQPVSG